MLNLQQEYIEYYLTDIKKQMKDKAIKVFLRWENMSTVGAYFADSIQIGEFRVPKNYMGP